ncbi:MAG: fructosamine kinase family protein [Bacteroidetes bacterium]|nr:fructosamine kinase family protein [Bacteroidota bacterium]
MFQSNENQFFESALFQTLGETHQVISTHFVSGGCINNTVKLETDKGVYFIKWNENADEDLFEKEEMGLDLIRSSDTIPTPKVFGRGRVNMKNFLIQEFIQKQAPKSDFWEIFGRKLANLHSNLEQKFGLDYDNHIGRLPQKNDYKENWVDFFIEHRLEVQLGLAIYNGLIDSPFARKFRSIYSQLPGIFPNEPASLLHGDLWSGNFMVGTDGQPFIYDPAVYYGNREVEISFTRLFGGFDRLFYQSYHEAFPLEPGLEDRIDIYNLYPLLVHVNLFGTSYLSGVERTVNRLV